MEGGLTSILNKVIACAIRYGIKNHYNLKCFIHKYTILKDKHKNKKEIIPTAISIMWYTGIILCQHMF